MSNITKYHNDLNTVKLRKWTAEEMNFLFAILTKVRDKGTDILTFSTNDLRNLSGDNFVNPSRWAQTMEGVMNKIFELDYVERTTSTIERIHLFRRFKLYLEERVLEIQVSEHFDYIVNNLQASFTKFELEEFTQIRSSYAKSLYRNFKQWRTVGRLTFKVSEFRDYLDIPKSYKAGQIDRDVITPAIQQLKPFFKGLTCSKVKERTAGTPIKEYVFTWKPEEALYESEKEYIEQKKVKKIKDVGSNVPDWHNPEYKNSTSADEQRKMEEEKQKLLDKFEKQQ